MKANELRIGNYVKFGKLFKKVVEIAEEGFYILDKDGTTLKNTWADLQPIPLTEEWLLKFGLEKELDSFYRFNKSSMIEICFYDGGILVTNQSVCLNSIKYVHQLQNLYFALTGEELVVSDAVS